MARTLVRDALNSLGGDAVWREGVVTDNGNIILDVHGLTITDPLELESVINNMTGGSAMASLRIGLPTSPHQQ